MTKAIPSRGDTDVDDPGDSGITEVEEGFRRRWDGTEEGYGGDTRKFSNKGRHLSFLCLTSTAGHRHQDGAHATPPEFIVDPSDRFAMDGPIQAGAGRVYAYALPWFEDGHNRSGEGSGSKGHSGTPRMRGVTSFDDAESL
ncbi:MAG: hypothetical protein ACKOCV_07330 [Gemmatimonadota bacterium]